MKTKNFPEKQVNRRIGAYERLKTQLNSGVKNTPDGEVSLTESDKTRIQNELKILGQRIDTNARTRRTKKKRGDSHKIYRS